MKDNNGHIGRRMWPAKEEFESESELSTVAFLQSKCADKTGLKMDNPINYFRKTKQNVCSNAKMFFSELKFPIFQ